MGQKVWRFFILLLLAGAACVLAFGPRPVLPAPTGRTRIQFWISWAGREAQQTKDLVDVFNNTVGKEKNIWVDFVAMSQMDNKLLISTAGGIPPDVAITWDAQILSYANAGALEDLGPYSESPEYPNLARDKFKPVFYNGCMLNGKLYAIPSTVWCMAFVWNKEIFQEKADQLRKAGLDPDRAPRTIAELDQYAQVIDTWDADHKHMILSGFIPSQPGPFTDEYAISFGAPYVDETGTKLLLTDPRMIATYDWIRSFSQRMGKDALANFNAGLGQFDSPSNPFMADQDAMEQMGPWIGAFIEKLKPEMNRWHVPADQLKREQDFQLIPAADPNPDHHDASGNGPDLSKPMTREEVEKLLGPGDPPSSGANPPPVPAGAQMLRWLAGIKDLYVTFVDRKATSKTWKLRPAEERKKYSQWGAAPFPSGIPGVENFAYAGMDALIIPKTSHHKKEAAEFINFMLRQDIMERLAMAHSNESPLVQQSDEYRLEHPNAYIDVWDKASASPYSRPLPRIVSWKELYDELTVVAEKSALLQSSSKELLTTLQRRAQMELNDALNVPLDRNLDSNAK